MHLHFLRSPIEFLETNGAVSGVRLEVTSLEPGTGPGATQRAVGTGITEDLPAQLVLESIGYKSCPIDGAPFDSKRGIIPNQLGQVLGADDGVTAEPGLFVCGWLKRGPSGIIGTNLVDAEQTVDTMVQQKGTLPALEEGKRGRKALVAVLEQRGVDVVDFSGWEKIDAEEVRRGAATGKPREKITDVKEMVKLAKAAGKT